MKNNQNIKNALRWIAVLPVAIAGIFAGTLAMNILSAINRWYVGASSDSGWARITFFLVAPAAGAALAVYWGSVVAPKGRKIVAMIIGALIVILNTLGVIGALASLNSDIWWIVAGGVASIIAAGCVVYYFFEESI